MSTFKIDLYSPRWGHADTYTIDMTDQEMTVRAIWGQMKNYFIELLGSDENFFL